MIYTRNVRVLEYIPEWAHTRGLQGTLRTMNMRKNLVGAGLSAMLCCGAVVAEQVQSFQAPTTVLDLAASNGGLAHGAAVAVAADVAVVGRPFNGGGVVDVYRRVATEATLIGVPWEWVHWCRLEPATPMAGSRFGNAVSVYGTTVVVGAWSDDRAGDNAGAAWVFELPESPQSLLTSEALLAPTDLLAGDYFGWDVAVFGDTIAVGAWGVDVMEPDDHAGAVWIFERQGDGFVEAVRLTAGTDATAGDRFGRAIDLNQDVLLVGAPYRASQSGAVYSFYHAGQSWSQVQRIDSPEGDAGEHFGAAVRVVLSGSTSSEGGAGVGAPGDDEMGPLAGAAWAFHYLGGGVFDQSDPVKATVDGGGAWDQAGSSIDGFDVDEGDDDNGDGPSGGGLLMGVPGWRNPDDGAIEGSVFFASVDDGGIDDLESFRLDLVTAEGGGMGTSVAVVHSSVDQWGFKTVTVVVGAPGLNGGLGAVTLIDVPVDEQDGDCNADGRFDPMEVIFEPSIHDCDGDGAHDSCQLYHDPWMDCDGDGRLDQCQRDSDPGLDCDNDGQLDSCQIAADPATLDCDNDGQLDSCQIAADPATLDCDGDGMLDSCFLAANPEADCDGDSLLDVCQIAADPAMLDCDGDGMLDACMIAANPASDCDGNGVLDACESPPVSGDSWWMTEQFGSGVDLEGLGIRLTPTGNPSPPLWQLCTTLSGDVWLDPSTHTPLQLSDDEAVLQSLPFPFEFAGQTWSDVYVCSNGYLTFGTADTTYTETLAAHFDRPRISGFFDDLDPRDGGQVLVGTGPAGSFVVTWQGIPEYSVPGTSNTVQVILHPDGAIEMSWPSLTATTAIVGPSIGGGVPSDFVLTDLSNAWLLPRATATETAFRMRARSTRSVIRSGASSTSPATLISTARWFVGSRPGRLIRRTGRSARTPSLPGRSTLLVTRRCTCPTMTSWLGRSASRSRSPVASMSMRTSGATATSTSASETRASGRRSTSSSKNFGSPGSWPIWTRPQAGRYSPGTVPPAPSSSPGWMCPSTTRRAAMSTCRFCCIRTACSRSPGSAEFRQRVWSVCPGAAASRMGLPRPTCRRAAPTVNSRNHSTIATSTASSTASRSLWGVNSTSTWTVFPTPASDVTRDGSVDVHDLLRVLLAWGDVKFASPDARCDLSPAKGDLRVDLADLLEVLVGMQEGCGQP